MVADNLSHKTKFTKLLNLLITRTKMAWALWYSWKLKYFISLAVVTIYNPSQSIYLLCFWRHLHTLSSLEAKHIRMIRCPPKGCVCDHQVRLCCCWPRWGCAASLVYPFLSHRHSPELKLRGKATDSAPWITADLPRGSQWPTQTKCYIVSYNPQLRAPFHRGHY